MYVSPGIAIIKREFLSGLRSGKPFLFLACIMLVMIAGLTFMLTLVFEDIIRSRGSIGGGDVRALFLVFSMGLYLSAILLVPPMAGVSICVEKQQDSYDLLRMTYIRPLALALAKLLNVLGIYLLVTVATLPVVGIFFFLVGIDWSQFIQSFAVIIASALSCAVIGLLCSAWFYRTLPAIITTYIIGFFLHGGFVFLAILLMETIWERTWFHRLFMRMDEEIVQTFCPLYSLVFIGEGRYDVPVTLGDLSFSLPVVVFALAYHAAIIVVGLWLTLLVLNRPVRPIQVDAEKPIDDQAQLQERRKKFPYYLLDPRRRRPMIPDDKNPVFSKELQTGLLGRGTFSVRVFYSFTIFCFVLSLFFIGTGDFRGQRLGAFVGWPIFIDTILVLFITPALVAMAMAKEHEWGNLDMLRMTLLDPGHVIAGKFRTALYTAFIPMGGTLLGCLPLLFFAYDSPFTWAGLLSGFGTMLVTVLYVLSLTLLVTVTCRRGVTALMLGYGATVFALLLLPALGLFSWLVATRGHGDGAFMEVTVSFLSPMVAQVSNLVNTNERRGMFLLNAYWLANVATYAALASVFLLLAWVRFRRALFRGMG